MKKDKSEDLVKIVITQQEEMNDLTVDRINEMVPDAEPEIQTKVAAKEKAKLENALFIEPKRYLKAFGKLPDRLKKQHAHDWEYVKGIFENFEVPGETVKFWFSWYPGDPDTYWEIPCNIAVCVPRMIAKHLEEVSKYHKFDYIQRPERQWHADEFTHHFAPTQTVYRSKFRPIGAFS